MKTMTPGNGFRVIFLIGSTYTAIVNLVFGGPVALLYILHSPLVLTFFNIVLLVGGFLLIVSMILNHQHKKAAADGFELAGLIIVGGLIFLAATANFSPDYVTASGIAAWHTPLGYTSQYMVSFGAALRIIYLFGSTIKNFRKSKIELEELQKENILLVEKSNLEGE